MALNSPIAKEEVELAKADLEATEFQVIAFSAAGKTTRQVAKAVGWDQKKVVNFLNVPENMKKLATAKSALLDAVSGCLIDVGRKATATLSDLMEDKDPSVALNAAKVTLENIIKLTGIGDKRGGDSSGPGIALQVNIGGSEAKAVVADELRKHHNR